jgi:CAAX protease family protein
MSDMNSGPPAAGAPPPVPPEPKQEALEAWVTKGFIGPDGIRAGWRLLIFLILVAALVTGLSLIMLSLGHGKPPKPGLTPEIALLNEGALFFIALFASWVMSKMERRKIADYGLPLRGAFGGKFWTGTAIGFASITALLVAMKLAGVVQFGPISLPAGAVAKYAAAWGAAFLFVAFFEEFGFRGYALFTLTTGMKFWPAAILLSAVFGVIHHSNPGESWVGAFTAGAVGLLFCLLVRRTGDLWMPIGFHAAWDWGQTYFYGVPDSGLVAPGHLFSAHFSGPVWLTGGTVGPEGSWLCVALLVMLWVIFALWLRETKYPNPDALSPKRRTEEAPILFRTGS